MDIGLSRVYELASRSSRIAITGAIITFGILDLFSLDISLSLQILIAVIALLVGIPHGAIDHLIAIPRESRNRFVLFILFYVLLAIAAGFVIATWNQLGFQLIIVISALHFGFGDAAFKNEWNGSRAITKDSFLKLCAYALPAGFLPVILPLTDSRALSALNRINPEISGWSGSINQTLRNITLALALIGLLLLLLTKNFQASIDLLLLLILSLLAPPLIAFAVYFGCWHAVRHTARLVPKLPKATLFAQSGNSFKAFLSAVIPGLYALIGTIFLALGLMVFRPEYFDTGLLWTVLVIIWALTIPHMLTTAKFDLQLFK
ncbi:MAG: beta-carotene 15,15'-dioxygenase, Brp/Blh family [Flammeovirgaceae bacterium]|nr:beta-carotene 15,15'-dioxygenase, Brp/Blh family [Flammeovirgaceae bacterium]